MVLTNLLIMGILKYINIYIYMDTNILGTGLSAVCVLPNKLKCKTDKKLQDTEYVSKIVEKPSDRFTEELYFAELYVSSVLKKRAIADRGAKWFYSRFAAIDDICDFSLEENVENKELLSRCKLDNNKQYVIFYTINGGCKKIKVGDEVRFSDKYKVYVGVVTTIYHNKFDIDVNGQMYKNIGKDKLKKGCGTLAENIVITTHFNTINKVTELFRYMLESLKYLHDIGIAHNDIKPNNIVMSSDGVIRIIDFGSGIYFNDDEQDTINLICTKYNNANANAKLDLEYLYLRVAAFTPGFVSPEFILASIVLNIDSNNSKEIVDIFKKIESYAEITLSNVDMAFITSLVENRKQFIKDMFCLKKEGKTPIMFKNDIYSMGKTILYISSVINIPDIGFYNTLMDLIIKMTTNTYDTRLNIDDCLSHPFFS